jgi:beta-hydroxylase
LTLLLYYDNGPFIKNINKVFPENIEFENNYYSKYKNELDTIYNLYSDVDCIKKNNPIFRIGDDKDKCWRAIYIKILDEFKIKKLEVICPNLYKILNKPYISNAMLSILDANVDIPEHYGYFKGFYRYHLGYIIPEYKNNKPFIVCGNEKYEWKEGKGVLFDDMFNHYVRNDTPYRRVVLYLDVIRPELRNDFITNSIIYLLSNNYFIKQLDKSQHTQKEIKN